MSEPFPTGEYKCVVIDPPWDAHYQGFSKGFGDYQAELPYQRMTLEQIVSLPVLNVLSNDAWLFVWTTNRFLHSALDWVDRLGLKYSWLMVWHKPSGPTPFNRPVFNAEFVVVARRGNPQLVGQNNFKTCFNAPQRAHSSKPAEFYNTLVRVTESPRLDIFSRRLIPGFDVWGDEAPTQVLPASQYLLFDKDGLG